MTDVRRSFLAFALIAIVLVLTPRYLKWVSPVPDLPAPADTLFSAGDEPSFAPAPRPFRAGEPEAVIPRRPDPLAAPRLAEQTWEIETPLYRAVISSKAGGSIATMELFGYASGHTDGNVQLIPQSARGLTLQLAYVNLDGDSVALNGVWEILRAPSQSHTRLEVGDTLTMEFRHRFPSGAEVSRKLSLTGDGYTLPMEIRWQRPTLELGINVYEIQWPIGLLPAEALLKEDEFYAKSYVYQGGELADLDAIRNGQEPRQTLKGTTNWVAMRNKYFAAALIAESRQLAEFGAFSGRAVPATEVGRPAETASRFSMAIGYPPNPRTNLSLYLGPLSYDLIRDLGVDLERIMNFGFALIRPVSKAILWAMVAMHEYIPNYGVILILFAVFVRIITNPLTRKSALSTQKMQIIQPQVQALQAKYKGNAQKLNKEMMALWRSEGVNPLGGCLPILIQLPLLWAFFIVFRTTIELRGQPFIFWVTDLSVPDVVFRLPFYIPLYGDGVTILALIMGLTMFFQQKFSGAASNPQQKPMMYIMTGMFFLLFNTFPSGLNLYYAFSNFLAIIQQRNIRKSLLSGVNLAPAAPAPKASAALSAKKPRRKKR